MLRQGNAGANLVYKGHKRYKACFGRMTMKNIQNILIALVALLILAGMFTSGWISIAFSTAAALIALGALVFSNNNKNQK